MINKKVTCLLFSSFALGVAFITRPTSILVIPPLFILMIIYYVMKSGIKTTVKLMAKDIMLFLIALFPFISLFSWYNYYRFGSIFETGYQLIGERTGVDNFTNTSFLTGLSGLLISPGKGFFYYTPVAILFFFSIKAFLKKHPRLGTCFIFIMISYLLFFSKFVYWHGDWAWGPRYLLVITPLLIIPIAELFESNAWKKRSFQKLVIYSIVLISLVIQIAAVSVDFQKYFIHLIHNEKIQFAEASGHDVLPIVEPPAENYFDWKKSPILAQFKFLYEIAKGINHYRYSPRPDDATQSLFVNVFDFWWLYKYFVDGSYSGIYIASMLLFIAIFTAVRLWSLSYKC